MRTIRGNLERMNVAQLMDIAFRLDVPHPEGKAGKAVWLQLALRAVEAMTPEELGAMLLPFEWQTLLTCTLLEKDGDITKFRTFYARFHSQVWSAFMRLQSLGLAWRERSYVYLLPVVMEAARLQDLQRPGLEGTLLEAADGLLRVVGCLPLEKLPDCIGISEREDHARDPLTEAKLPRILALWRMRMGMAGIHLVNGETWLSAEGCAHIEQLALSHLVGKGKSLAYPRLALRECTRISHMRTPVAQEACKPLLDLLQRSGAGRDYAWNVLSRAVLSAQREQQEDAIELLSRQLKTNPNPAQMLMLSAFFEAVPVWELKGHTEAELMTDRYRPVSGPRANGLCSCGSGKLYRRCCGRMS